MNYHILFFFFSETSSREEQEHNFQLNPQFTCVRSPDDSFFMTTVRELYDVQIQLLNFQQGLPIENVIHFFFLFLKINFRAHLLENVKNMNIATPFNLTSLYSKFVNFTL